MLTIVIPTRDRSPFLIRLLSYWADLGFPYPILIGDSSVSPHCEETQRAIGHFSGRLTIRYRKFPSYRELGPGEGTIQCMNGLLEEVGTPYVIFVADDDFVVPDALREAVHFLEQHPDYSAVVGESGFMTVSGGPHGQIQEVWRYPQFALEEPQARQRLLRYLKNTFTTEHAIKRTPQMQAQWKAAKDLPMNNRFGEILVGGLLVLQGKVHRMNRLYLFRQSHEGMLSLQNPSEVELDSIAESSFAKRYTLLRDFLGQQLSCADGISLKGAKGVIKEGFWWKLAYGLERKWKIHFAQAASSGPLLLLRQQARSLSPLRQFWRSARCWIPRPPGEMSLAALLQPISPYHADFMPIYRAVTMPLSRELSLAVSER